jgi:hypothetical protein
MKAGDLVRFCGILGIVLKKHPPMHRRAVLGDVCDVLVGSTIYRRRARDLEVLNANR